ncbi:hypothetical protein [Pantoea sp. KPR_PJ]|uniref:hypothetical protein n=1 Tax=Pantoea sp. KPR_PJ TaxID=2738375 RepID=UPI0035295B00
MHDNPSKNHATIKFFKELDITPDRYSAFFSINLEFQEFTVGETLELYKYVIDYSNKNNIDLERYLQNKQHSCSSLYLSLNALILEEVLIRKLNLKKKNTRPRIHKKI